MTGGGVPAKDPFVSYAEYHRTTRGGNWFYYSESARAAYHYDPPPYRRLDINGFRVVRTVF